MIKYLILFAFLIIQIAGLPVFTISTSSTQTAVVSVSNSEKFALKFSSNPSTGYDWYFTNITSSSSADLVEFLNLTEYGGGVYKAASTGLLGSGGYTYFLLESSDSETGQVKLEFTYKRIWETTGVEQKKYVKIKVTAAS